MSDILTDDERRDLTIEKHELLEKSLRATSQGEADRLSSRVMKIQKQLDEDANERLRTGADEARAWAARIVAGAAPASQSSPELREFVKPGSGVSQMWVTPPNELTIGTPAQFAGRSEQRADFLTTDTATIGSAYYFTPVLYQNVVMGLLEASGVLEAQPTLIVTNHLRDIQVPVLTADASATAGAEGSPGTDTNPTGDAVTLGAYRFDGVFNVSIEMLMASEYNLEGLLSTFATRAIANKVAAMLALGNGTTEPLGLFTASAVTEGKVCSSATDATVDEVLACTKALGKGYRKNARMVVSDVLHTSLLSAKQGDGDYILDSIEGGGYQFAGKPMFTEPQADQTSMSANEIHAVYGDFAGYFVRTTPMFFKRTDGNDPLNPKFTFAVWLDAKVADANALVSLKMGS